MAWRPDSGGPAEALGALRVGDDRPNFVSRARAAAVPLLVTGWQFVDEAAGAARPYARLAGELLVQRALIAPIPTRRGAFGAVSLIRTGIELYDGSDLRAAAELGRRIGAHADRGHLDLPRASR